jgi:transposase
MRTCAPSWPGSAWAYQHRPAVGVQIARRQQGLPPEVRHPDAEVYRSQPGLGQVLAARVLAEFGDDPTRYANARSRKNYAGTSSITSQSGKKKLVLARYVHNDRLIDAVGRQDFAAMTASPGARAYYDELRCRGVGHHAALRQLANRLVGILHGCLKTGTTYNEATAWSHRDQKAAA